MWKGSVLIPLFAYILYPIMNDFAELSGACSIHIFSLLDLCLIYMVDSLTGNILETFCLLRGLNP